MTLYVVIGPPAAGKSTWVQDRAQAGDLILDMDRLLETLSPIEPYGRVAGHVRHVAHTLWQAALDDITLMVHMVDVYVTECTPKAETIDLVHAYDGKIVVVDPGKDVVLERCHRLRPAHLIDVVNEWYLKEHDYEPADTLKTQPLRRALGYERMARVERANAARLLREADRLDDRAEKHRKLAQ